MPATITATGESSQELDKVNVTPNSTGVESVWESARISKSKTSHRILTSDDIIAEKKENELKKLLNQGTKKKGPQK
jgi:hypothetical protein